MMFDNTTILSTLIILLLAAVSVISRKLTLLAGFTGSLLAIIIWAAYHYTGMLMLGSFFLFGSFATGWKASQKQNLSSSQLEEERRTTGQVLANGGVAGLLAIIALLFPAHRQCFQLMMAGSFAAALSDTFSSELGNVYGKRFYNICTFRKDQRGENGVISLEGSIAGIAGAGIIAILFYFIQDCNSCLVILLMAGISGNLVDSLLGAKFERSGHIGNNLVNFFNTGVGAGVAWAGMKILNFEFYILNG